jgi:hypothetical protein
MGHAMDPLRIRSITIMDIFCDINPCPLKNINTIYPKIDKLWAIWFRGKPPPIISASIITLVRLSFPELATIISKDIRMRILT